MLGVQREIDLLMINSTWTLRFGENAAEQVYSAFLKRESYE
jgi:hypothetical protein